jgi:periplasmic protein TonB
MTKTIITLFISLLFANISNAQSWGDKSVKENRVFYSVEQAPKFPGGMTNFYKFVSDSLKMPTEKFSTFSNKFEIVKIFINEQGKVFFAEIEKSINENYDMAVLEFVKKMPNWSPGLQNGHAVTTAMSIPLVFVD